MSKSGFREMMKERQRYHVMKARQQYHVMKARQRYHVMKARQQYLAGHGTVETRMFGSFLTDQHFKSRLGYTRLQSWLVVLISVHVLKACVH